MGLERRENPDWIQAMSRHKETFIQNLVPDLETEQQEQEWNNALDELDRMLDAPKKTSRTKPGTADYEKMKEQFFSAASSELEIQEKEAAFEMALDADFFAQRIGALIARKTLEEERKRKL